MLTMKVFFLWLHIGAIVVWIGGLFAMSFVFVPTLRGGLTSPSEAARLAANTAQRFQRVSRELVAIILITGIFNLIFAGIARSFQFGAGYLSMLGVKVVFFIVIVGLQLWQTTRLYPALTMLTADAGTHADTASEAVKKLRRRALTASVLSSVLALVAILLGLQLRFH
jgi:uncharacterized membrane protein